MIIWVVKISFVQFFCVFLPLLLNILFVCYCLSLLFFPLLCPSLHEIFSNFLEEISSLSHSIIFLYFFALITEEGFPISPCYSLELCVQVDISFLELLPLASLLFSAICKASSGNHFAFLLLFFWGWPWSLPPVQCHESPSIVIQALCLSDLVLWICHSHCIIIRDLI